MKAGDFMKKRLVAFAISVTMLLPLLPIQAQAADYGQYGFTEVKTQKANDDTYHLLKHTATGAQVLWQESDDTGRVFMAGFRTPPTGGMGENHVLEHALLCGSEKYPVRELMHQLESTSVADLINAYTSEDYTCYVARTQNETDFYNLADVFMDSVLHPLLRTEPNIFQQQGIRLEYADGKAQYNGIVYSELRLRNLETEEQSINLVSDQMYQNLYGGGSPARDSGGRVPDIFNLTYADVMRVYNTYYKPSNMLIYVAGKQDINKTLSILDKALDTAEQGSVPEITFDSNPIAQTETVQEYRMTDMTKTVDIGFMAHGPQVLDLKKSDGWGALVSALYKKLHEKYPDAQAYTVGGLGGGIYNVGLILSGIPAAQRNEVIETFRTLLDEIARDGLDEKTQTQAVDSQKREQQFGSEEIFQGFAYGGDPFACLGRSAVLEALKKDNGYFKTLAAEWRDTPYQTIVIVASGEKKKAISEPQVSGAQLEQVKKDTEAFNTWVNTPASPEAIASLPQLPLREFEGDPVSYDQKNEQTDGISWYRTTDEAAEPSFTLQFPIAAKADDLPAWCLLCELLNDSIRSTGASAWCGVSANEKAADQEILYPTFAVSGTGESGKVSEAVQAAAGWLSDPPLHDTASLRDFLTKRVAQLRSIYSDPYSTEYCYYLMAQSQPERFLCGAPTGFDNSSPRYKAFVDAAAANPDGDAALLARLRGLMASALQRSGIAADFTGSDTDYYAFQTAAKTILAPLPEGHGVSSCEFLPGGWPSALVVCSNAQDSTHVMQFISWSDEQDMAALRVLAKVLKAKYLLPELRDRLGAYGANISVEAEHFSFSSAGGVPIDTTIEVYQRAADWLRNLSLTENELNGYIIGALRDYDDRAKWSRTSALDIAQSGLTQSDYARERAEILSVTTERLKACAPLLDQMQTQGHVFAQTTKAAEKNTKYPFACRVDADTGVETPLLLPDIAESPDQTPLTRGGMAALLAQNLRDQSAAEQSGLARFSDVALGSETADALAKLHDRGVLNGYPDGTFRPDHPITRAEFCAIASTLLRDGTSSAVPAFTDVPASHWAYGVISRMAAQGILLGGGDGTFRPESPITRHEATLILRRLAGA